MDFIKSIIARYTAWVWSLLEPLGAWGVFGIATVDAAFLGIPLDPVVATYVYSDQSRFMLYVLMASIGSTLGSSVVYYIGRKGEELLLEKRIPKGKLDKIRASFERHEVLALAVPAMLPPPTPFKLFVLTAGALKMRYTHFFFAIFIARMVRFTILSLLTLAFGPHIVTLTGTLWRQHRGVFLLTLAALALGGYVIYRLWKRPASKVVEEIRE